MRYKSTERMEQIKSFVETYYENHQLSPSLQEIADAIGTAKSTVFRYLEEMTEKGMITYDGQAIHTDKTLKQKGERRFAPILGRIPCGTPEEEEEAAEEYVPLPKAIFGEGEFFILRASGESMINVGIDHGDLVVIRKQETADPGDIIAALVDGTSSTLKTLLYDDNGKAYLHPENGMMDDIVPEYALNIQGIAVYVMKKLGPVRL